MQYNDREADATKRHDEELEWKRFDHQNYKGNVGWEYDDHPPTKKQKTESEEDQLGQNSNYTLDEEEDSDCKSASEDRKQLEKKSESASGISSAALSYIQSSGLKK